MRKLLQINPVVRENTSTGKIMRELGELAQADGWECYIAYSRARDGVPPHSSHLVPVGNHLDLLFHWLATRLFDAHGLASRYATRQLIRRIREINPDIVHIHNVHGYFLNYPMLCRFLAERGKPVIWTVHDCWIYTGHCYYYSAVKCNKWQTGCGHCPQKHAFPASWLFGRSARNWRDKQRAFGSLDCLTLAPVSDWIRQEMAYSFLADKPYKVIHNGIDLDTFRPRLGTDVRSRYGIPEGSFVLAVASIWLPEKGLPDLIRLANRLDTGLSLVIVGRLTSDQQSSLPSQIVTIPRTSDAVALAELYSEALAFVNPTWQDNYPTVNLEAIACGTPVVTYRTGGSVESVPPETGVVVEQGDIDGLVQALRSIQDKGKAGYSGNCRSFALANFSKEDRFKDYLYLYRLLLENK